MTLLKSLSVNQPIFTMAFAIDSILELHAKAIYELHAGFAAQAKTSLQSALMLGVYPLGSSPPDEQHSAVPKTCVPKLAEISMPEVVAPEEWTPPPTDFDLYCCA